MASKKTQIVGKRKIFVGYKFQFIQKSIRKSEELKKARGSV